jgi:hypothetical protein
MQSLEDVHFVPHLSNVNVVQNEEEWFGIFNKINFFSFQSAEFDLWDHVTAEASVSDPKSSANGAIVSHFKFIYVPQYPHYCFQFPLSRKWAYYGWNVFLILFAISSLSATSFAIDPRFEYYHSFI